MGNLDKAKTTLLEKDFTCVVVNDEEMRTSTLSGIRPLMQWLSESEEAFKGASIADRCIGRAAAFLMLYGGVKEIYTKLISEHALELLNAHQIHVEYDEKVPYIINRDQTGMCPMEETCLNIDEPKEAYQALQQKLAEMSRGK